jgi:ABC-type protease/lipase transport system fused ATPase/permease subunit
MMIPGWFTGISIRAVLIAVAAIALVLVGAFTVRSCDKRHSKAAQSRVEASQAQAASNSAADAIGTVAASGAASEASEALTRSNEQKIRAANGANTKVDPAVRDAGIAALCRRKAYENDPRCHRP